MRVLVFVYLAFIILGLNLIACSGGDRTPNSFPEPEPDTEPQTTPVDDPVINKMFSTSASGIGNLSSWADAAGNTGLAAADAICQARAAAGGLTGSFRAWLSDLNDDAYCRMHNLTGKKSNNCGQANLPTTAGPWLRTDNFPFSESIALLTNAAAPVIYSPAQYDESGNFSSLFLQHFTATTEEGVLNEIYTTCGNWTDENAGSTGMGSINGTSWRWTDGFSSPCNSSHRLLCMQSNIPAQPLDNFAIVGKKVFITSTIGNGDLGSWADAGGQTGIAAGDAICTARAAAEGLSGIFKAWLSNTSIDAIDRLTSDTMWVRMDGAKIADSKSDLTDESIFTSISVTEAGDYLPSNFSWTGTHSDGFSSAITCNDWTDSTTGVSATIGSTTYVKRLWSNQMSIKCSRNIFHLYCFED